MLVAKDKGIEIMTDLFNRIKSKWKFPSEWKITSASLSKEWNQDDPGNWVGIYIYHQLLWKIWRNTSQQTMELFIVPRG